MQFRDNFSLFLLCLGDMCCLSLTFSLLLCFETQFVALKQKTLLFLALYCSTFPYYLQTVYQFLQSISSWSQRTALLLISLAEIKTKFNTCFVSVFCCAKLISNAFKLNSFGFNADLNEPYLRP